MLEQQKLLKEQETWTLLAERKFNSLPGIEFQALEWLAATLQSLPLPAQRLTNLKTAVSEAVINALEHGNQFQPEKLVTLQILFAPSKLLVRIQDEGTSGSIHEPASPDLAAQLHGLQMPSGWGLSLMRRLADEVRLSSNAHSHTVEIIMSRAGGICQAK